MKVEDLDQNSYCRIGGTDQRSERKISCRQRSFILRLLVFVGALTPVPELQRQVLTESARRAQDSRPGPERRSCWGDWVECRKQTRARVGLLAIANTCCGWRQAFANSPLGLSFCVLLSADRVSHEWLPAGYSWRGRQGLIIPM